MTTTSEYPPFDEIPPAPGYEIVATRADLYNPDTLDKQQLVQVKLSKPRVARIVGTSDYIEVDNVLIGLAHLTKSDRSGTFVYEETTVTACDDDGKQPEHAMLYMVNRMLSVEEALFAIGEI